MDYEGELAVVIGSPAHEVSEDEALAHVAGAMAFNDVSARDLQLANQLWTGGKAVDTFGPCGPALVTVDELDDLGALVPGDVIATGTPPGVGAARTPQRFLDPGDLVEVEIGGVGRLANRVAGPIRRD